MHLPSQEAMQFMHQDSPFLGFGYEPDEPHFSDTSEIIPMGPYWPLDDYDGDDDDDGCPSLHQALHPQIMEQIPVPGPSPYFDTNGECLSDIGEQLSGNQVTMNPSSSSSSSSSSSLLQGYEKQSYDHIYPQNSSPLQDIVMFTPPSHSNESLMLQHRDGDALHHDYTSPTHGYDQKRKKDSSESEDSLEEVVVSRKPRQGRSTKRARAAETHNQSERNRRGRINEKLKALQELIPNANKTDKASLLTEVINYLKKLRLQLQVMSYRNAIMNTSSPRGTHQQHMPPIAPGMPSNRTNFQHPVQVGFDVNPSAQIFSNAVALQPSTFREDLLRAFHRPGSQNPSLYESTLPVPSFILQT